MLTDAQTQQYRNEGYLTLPGVFTTADLEPVDAYLANTRWAALTIRYVPAATRIRDQPDRRQFLVRGRAVANGNVYYQFGKSQP
jgi:hypothetical protein